MSAYDANIQAAATCLNTSAMTSRLTQSQNSGPASNAAAHGRGAPASARMARARAPRALGAHLVVTKIANGYVLTLGTQRYFYPTPETLAGAISGHVKEMRS